MKRCNLFLVLAAAAFLQFLGLSPVRAQQLFPAVFSTTCVSTNASGGLSSEHMGNQDLISDCAGLGITNLSGLKLVYNLTSNALQVVAGTNVTTVGTNHTRLGTNLYLICTPLRFTNIVSLSTTNTNKVELLSSVFVETNSRPTGTLAATERFQYDTNNLVTSFSLIGRIQYAELASGTNGASICRGVLLAGVPAGQEDEGEEGEEGGEGHGNNGNNGNHGKGNNGRHLGQIMNGNNGNGHHDDSD